MIRLGDMPDVPDAHLLDLRATLTPDRSAVMSAQDGALLPSGSASDVDTREDFAALAVTRPCKA